MTRRRRGYAGIIANRPEITCVCGTVQSSRLEHGKTVGSDCDCKVRKVRPAKYTGQARVAQISVEGAREEDYVPSRTYPLRARLRE